MSAGAIAGASTKKRPVAFFVIVALILLLPLLGKGGILASAILAMALTGAPLFVIIGVVTVLSFLMWAGFSDLASFSVLIERIRTLADQPTLLAIPLFIMSGAVMSQGQISTRLVEFARALVGWIPGGLAISAVLACMLFAAISGSSPATVVAIGAMMAPTLIKAGYRERFAHGLVTSAGSLGILIPPSIPMIIYPLVNQGAVIEVERLFASGFGPGFVIGGILIGMSIYRGIRDKAERSPFDAKHLLRAIVDGFWALMFPILILGGIYSGFFNAVEAAAVSVVYAVVVEVWVHGALELRQVPRIVQETGIFLGSLLVIMVAALAFSEFLELEGIPHEMVGWIRGMDLQPWQFLVIVNLLLLVVGMAMDILSAMFIFVPLLAPIAAAMGIDPIHFGIIFIVNLEIGYLTPPVGLNLFVAGTLFNRPLGHIIRSVAPFIVWMIVGLGVITWFPEISIGLGNRIMGDDAAAAPPPADPALPEEEIPDEPATVPTADEPMQTMEEMMREAEGGAAGDVGEAEGAEGANEAPPPGGGSKRMQTMEEMMREAGVR